MLDPLDKELEKRGHKFARYADDIIIVVKSQRAGERVLGSVTRYLEERLKLQVNIDKSRVVKPANSKFLGFCFPQGRIQWHVKALEKFRARVRELTNRNWGGVHKVPIRPTEYVSARLDKLLWHCQWLPALLGAGQLDKTQNQDVLLATVAQSGHPHPKSNQTWRT